MANSFRNKIFFIVFIITFTTVMVVITQSGYLSRKRFIKDQDHSHRSRMHIHSSKQALQHYRPWSKRQYHLQDGKEDTVPQGEEDVLLHHRAWSMKQPLRDAKKSTITRDNESLELYGAWSKKHSLMESKKAANRKEDEIFNQISFTKTNDTKWINSFTDEYCTPRKHIAFFKMHKCSSSTVQNILFRFGERHMLDFVLPPIDNILGRTYFDKSFMIQFPVEKYNMLCHHTRFSAKGFAEVMSDDAVYTTIIRDPVKMYESSFTYLNVAFRFNLTPEGFAEVMSDDAVYTTIIRDPVKMYESSFTYLNVAFRFNLAPEGGLEQFMQRPSYYYNRNIYSNSHVKNPMLYDLGLQDSDQFSSERITLKILELIEQFDLVMITEYFDESLILLRHLMCWQIDDMVYFVLNARSMPSVPILSPDLADKIRDWNAGDVILYDVFNRTFWNRIEAFGADRMREEVEMLRERITFYDDYCIAGVIDNDAHVWHPSRIKINSFKLKAKSRHDPTCSRMIRPEIPYTQSLRYLQLRRYNMHKYPDVVLG